MATIEFSTGSINILLNYTFGLATPPALSVTASGTTASLRIMKGTMPSDFSLATNGTTSYSTDVLIPFNSIGSSSTDALYISVVSGNTFTLNTRTKLATASGTATWFWWLVYTTSSPGVITNQVMGTVGLIGSGADLEIPNVSIISGNPYRISGVKWYVPDGGFTY